MNPVLLGADTTGALITELILLERDATAAYVRIQQRLADARSREAIGQFLGVRQGRLAELTRMSFALRSGAPGEADARHYLPTGRITLGCLFSDRAILDAMRVGEDETVAAYERAVAHPQASPRNRAHFERYLDEALQHRSWADAAARAQEAT
jgi:hypothetical protein